MPIEAEEEYRLLERVVGYIFFFTGLFFFAKDLATATGAQDLVESIVIDTIFLTVIVVQFELLEVAMFLDRIAG